MKVLVINAGSSSLKFTVFQMPQEEMLAKGVVERIGLQHPQMKFEPGNGDAVEGPADVQDQEDALRLSCEKLVDPDGGVLNDLSEIEAIGHRVVHGGEKFSDSVEVTGDVKQAIDACSSLAPLHNPANLAGITACEDVFRDVANVAVFDTAFHATMPPTAYKYAIPHRYYEAYGARKYGFHGTSHKYIAQAGATFLGRRLEDLKLITCHLGNGCSVAAVDGGRVVDTSMGMTPLEGLIMGTRCGDIDPGVVIHLIKSGVGVDDVDRILNKESGLLGAGRIGSSDMRDIVQAVKDGNAEAECALDMFVHRLVRYIGGYYTVLGGADAVILTGGMGENSIFSRGRVIRRLGALGCFLDEEKNDIRGEAVVISTPESTMTALIMPTNEELMIARETVRIIGADQT